jgi:hypothetical protein
MVSVMALGNYHGPDAAAREYAQSLSAACIDGQMPDDWPGHAGMRESVIRHFDLAHKQDPKLEMPQWPRTGPPPPAQARAQDPAQSNLGVYGKTSAYCGPQAIPRNSPTIPEIGCFHLSPGHRATGTFSTHRVEVSVDSAGKEAFKVDGALVMEARDTASGTKLPYVGVGGVAGYRFCEGPTDRDTGCPADITIFSRNSDKTVLFMVSECLPPEYHLCVSTQENWNYAKSQNLH